MRLKNAEFQKYSCIKKSYFIIVCCTVIFLLIVIYRSYRDITINTKAIVTTESKQMKYILQWTSDKTVPFVDMGKGQKGFISRKCPHNNCYVTSDKKLLGDYTNFDVIAFAGPDLAQDVFGYDHFPVKRLAHQKYAFGSIESSHNYMVCFDGLNDYFNWTWTYKLDSDVRWGYIVIRDMHNNIIGPKIDMNWLKFEDMIPITESFKKKLKTKKRAAAWMVSSCVSESKREFYVVDLKIELNKYKHDIDIYGSCGDFDCDRENDEMCNKKIAEEYYFYLSFENSFSEDYVTEKLLRALKNDAVPIVYGGANYTRFMPDGIYLNARILSPQALAAKMNELINDPEKYAKYFKWKNHYSYHRTTESVETNEYCSFCEILNDDEAVKKTTVYHNFIDWWNPPNSCSNETKYYR